MKGRAWLWRIQRGGDFARGGYTAREAACRACMGPCGVCRYPEREKRRLALLGAP